MKEAGTFFSFGTGFKVLFLGKKDVVVADKVFVGKHTVVRQFDDCRRAVVGWHLDMGVVDERQDCNVALRSGKRP